MSKPDHYEKLNTDVFTVIKSNAPYAEAVGFYRYNIMKYAMRSKGDDVGDAIKIIAYANEWIKHERRKITRKLGAI